MAGIRKDAIDVTVDYLDDKIKAGIAEPIDGLGIRLLLNFANDKLFSKMPEEDCEILSDSMVNIFDDNEVTVEELEEEAANISTILSGYIKIPLVDNTPEENAIIEGVLIVIIKSIEALVEKVKAKNEE
jgi:hypothetical protein